MSKTFQVEEDFEKAYVLIKCKTDSEGYILDHLGLITNVKEVEYTTGVNYVLVGVKADTIERLHETIVSEIQKIPMIYSTTTLICGQACMGEGNEL